MDARFDGLIQAIDRLLEKQTWVWIAVDGRCASGKSTLGEALKNEYSGNLFHMDDYFLPFPRKTPERLSEPGGNVDYERFFEEVIAPGRGVPIEWRSFDCVAQRLRSAVVSPPARLTIVEGSYALHPTLRDAYDLKVFLSIDLVRQSERILRRNGPEKHRKFTEEWIPLEEHYFAELNIRALCDFAYDL